LEKRKAEITHNFRSSLGWERSAEKQETFIFVSHDGDIESSDSELEEIREWHIRKLLKLKGVFQPEIKQVSKTLG